MHAADTATLSIGHRAKQRYKQGWRLTRAVVRQKGMPRLVMHSETLIAFSRLKCDCMFGISRGILTVILRCPETEYECSIVNGYIIFYTIFVKVYNVYGVNKYSYIAHYCKI